MAGPLNSDAVPAVEQPSAVEQQDARPRSSARAKGFRFELRHRFGIAYLVLAALVGAAVGLFVVFLGDSSSGGPAWSTFKPRKHGQEAAAEIAHYIQGRYRLANGNLLVHVIEREATIESSNGSVPIRVVAVRSGFADQRPQDVPIYHTDKTIVYALCGDGMQCSIPGASSNLRGALVQREILELALYTFKYVGADSVLAYVPPLIRGSGANAKVLTRAAFVVKSTWKKQLEHPLAATLPQRKVNTVGSLTQDEVRIIRRVSLLGYQFQPLGDGSALLVLAPPTA